MAAVDSEYFAGLVREALTHLHDGHFLEMSPLREVLLAGSREPAAKVLREALIDAVEALKPEPVTPQDSPRWRRYAYIRRRYVEGIDPDQIAKDLAIGERQARRYNHDGLEEVSTRLRSQCPRWRPLDGWHAAPAVRQAETIATELAVMASSATVEPTPVIEVLASALRTAAKVLEDRRIVFEASLPPDLPPVLVQRVALRQALLGILLYAAEWHIGSRVWLTASAERGDVVVEVVFSSPPGGRGEARQAIEPRAGSAAHDGLREIQYLAESQGGVLTTQPGRAGVEYLHLILPASPITRVLVIDDNPDFHRLFQRFLEGSSYRALYAEQTQDPVVLATEARPDIITLDILMPTRDGWEVLQALKNEPATGDIPVVVCSVLREPTLALALGVSAVLVKPVTREELLAALDGCRL